MASVLVEMEHLVAEALRAAFPDQQEKPLVAATRDSRRFGGDYQCNNAMSLFAKLRGKVSGLLWTCCRCCSAGRVACQRCTHFVVCSCCWRQRSDWCNQLLVAVR